jgi:hypothetical protein
MRNLIYTLLLVLMGGEVTKASLTNLEEFIRERGELERKHNIIVLPIFEDLGGIDHEASKTKEFDFVRDVKDLYKVFESLKDTFGEYKAKEAHDFQKFSPKSRERFKTNSQKIYFLKDVVTLYEGYGFKEKVECFKKEVDELLLILESSSPHIKRRAHG